MATRKSMKLPVFITLLFICIIVYLFTNIKQTVVVCKKTKTFDSNITLKETLTSTIDGKKIRELTLTKKIMLPDRFSKKEESLVGIRNSLEYTLDYLGKNVSYEMIEGGLIVHIHVSNNELVLLDNLSFSDNNGNIGIEIDANTKSSNVIALSVGDNYTDGELKKKLKNYGYVCN